VTANRTGSIAITDNIKDQQSGQDPLQNRAFPVCRELFRVVNLVCIMENSLGGVNAKRDHSLDTEVPPKYPIYLNDSFLSGILQHTGKR
jgi:hypothetical protein